MSKESLSTGIPGMRYLPTTSNREAWLLEKEVSNLILQVVKEMQEGPCEKALLQMVVEGDKGSELSQDATNRFIVDNCKNIYLAGYKTTVVAATWCLMLLASNKDWQDQVRKKVLQVCGGQTPDADMLHKLEQVKELVPGSNSVLVSI